MAEPQAPTGDRRLAVALVLCGGVGLLAVCLWPPSPPLPMSPEAAAEASAPRPSESRRARALQAKPDKPKVAAVDEQAPVEVRIRLGPQDRLHRSVYMSLGAHKAHQLLPAADEAPWPDHPASDRLQELLEADAEGLPRAEREALAELLIEAADDPALLASPWGQLITFEARKRESLLAWCKQVSDDECKWHWYAEGDVPPERDHLGLDADARALFEAHPDDAVGDFAALYLLAATQDEVVGVETALAVLASTPDPLVAAQAASRLMRYGRFSEPLDRTEMALVAEAWHEMTLPQRLPLALMGVDFAVQRGDLSQAAVWQGRAELVREENCEAGHFTCEAYLAELAMTRGQLAALSGEAPTSWSEVLTAAGWACHETDPLPVDTSVELEGQWADGWRFTGWGEADPAFVACFEAEADRQPVPPDQARVLVKIRT